MVVARARGGRDDVARAGAIEAVFGKAGSSQSGKYRKPDVPDGCTLPWLCVSWVKFAILHLSMTLGSDLDSRGRFEGRFGIRFESLYPNRFDSISVRFAARASELKVLHLLPRRLV